MRDTKYRGLTLDTKQWVYGYYCQVEGKHFIILDDAELTGGFGLEPKSALIGFIEVNPETVGQFICKDKNGKEIYEGDIVKNEDGEILVILWCEQEIGWRLYKGCFYKATPQSTEYTPSWQALIWQSLKVIGTVAENPELLGERK